MYKMAMEKIGDGLKKILLVGIGAAATTVEKSSQIIDDLVKKGEITVEQGKELNKELQHNVRKTMEARKADAVSIEEKLAKMSADELALLKSKIAEAEKAIDDVTGVTEGDEIAAASAELDAMDDALKDEGHAPAGEVSEE
jgi:polyhydroxyalkanoate synthesis regulator phasin